MNGRPYRHFLFFFFKHETQYSSPLRPQQASLSVRPAISGDAGYGEIKHVLFTRISPHNWGLFYLSEKVQLMWQTFIFNTEEGLKLKGNIMAMRLYGQGWEYSSSSFVIAHSEQSLQNWLRVVTRGWFVWYWDCTKVVSYRTLCLNRGLWNHAGTISLNRSAN